MPRVAVDLCWCPGLPEREVFVVVFLCEYLGEMCAYVIFAFECL